MVCLQLLGCCRIILWGDSRRKIPTGKSPQENSRRILATARITCGKFSCQLAVSCSNILQSGTY